MAPWLMKLQPEESEGKHDVTIDDLAFTITGLAGAIPELDMGKFMDGLCHSAGGFIIRAPKKICYIMKETLAAANGMSYINVKGHNFYFTIHPEGKSPPKRPSSCDYASQVPTVRVMIAAALPSRMEAKHQDTRLGKDKDDKRNECSVEMIMPPKSKDEEDGNAVYSPFPSYITVEDTIDGESQTFRVKYNNELTHSALPRTLRCGL
eukprot:5922202-Prymnesium_polylepis.2